MKPTSFFCWCNIINLMVSTETSWWNILNIRLTMRKRNTCPKFKRFCETIKPRVVYIFMLMEYFVPTLHRLFIPCICSLLLSASFRLCERRNLCVSFSFSANSDISFQILSKFVQTFLLFFAYLLLLGCFKGFVRFNVTCFRSPISQ